MQSITIFTPLLGGILIGAAASGLLFFNGRIAGISNIVAGLLPPRGTDPSWRAAFVAGLLTGGAVLLWVAPNVFARPPRALPTVALAGLFVGLGARVSNGCTSGHGVCGLGRRSARSLAATATFMATGVITVYIVNHLFRGSF